MRLLQALLFLVATMLPAAAYAQLPASCYMHYYDDSFEGSYANDWNIWDGSVVGDVVVGATNSARSGSNAARFSFGSAEPTGSFLIIEQLLSVGYAQTKARRPKYGCASVIPAPSGQPDYCSASVWVKSAGDGATGYFQLIDPFSYDYLASVYFASSSGSWFQVTIPSTTACLRDMLVRVQLVRTSSQSDAMVVDDLRITWNY